MAIFSEPVTQAAWKEKPTWAVVATSDKAIDPELLRQTAVKIGATAVEVPASHVPFVTQPQAVADVIDAAARGSVGN